MVIVLHWQQVSGFLIYDEFMHLCFLENPTKFDDTVYEHVIEEEIASNMRKIDQQRERREKARERREQRLSVTNPTAYERRQKRKGVSFKFIFILIYCYFSICCRYFNRIIWCATCARRQFG
jgi:hypothetical protein